MSKFKNRMHETLQRVIAFNKGTGEKSYDALRDVVLAVNSQIKGITRLHLDYVEVEKPMQGAPENCLQIDLKLYKDYHFGEDKERKALGIYDRYFIPRDNSWPIFVEIPQRPASNNTPIFGGVRAGALMDRRQIEEHFISSLLMDPKSPLAALLAEHAL